MTTRPLILALGEILWDLLPGGKQLGGAPANFAYHAARLGADARIVSSVGEDALGREIVDRPRAQGLDTGSVAIDPIYPTGTVTVLLDAGQPTYTIHEDVAWDHLAATPAVLELAGRADCVYFGTLAQRSPAARAAIREILASTRPEAMRVLDVNLRQHYFGREVVDESLRRATVLKISDDEVPRVAQLLGVTGSLFERYPNLRWMAQTRGGNGARLIARDGEASDHPGASAEPFGDAIGAGDAFTAALAVGLLAGRSPDDINGAANTMAAYVCTRAGATPDLPDWLIQRIAGPGHRKMGE